MIINLFLGIALGTIKWKAYLFFIILIGAFYFSYLIGKRFDAESKEPIGFISYIRVALVFVPLTFVSIYGASVMGNSLYRVLVFVSYQAIIVDQVSGYSEDSDGNSTLMYTPTVEYTPKGLIFPVRAELNVSSGGKYVIGDTYKIIYNPEDGDTESAEGSTIVLLLVGLFFVYAILFVVIYGVCFALYIPLSFNLIDIIKVVFLYTLVPLTVLGMDIGLLNYLFRVFRGAEEAPVVMIVFLLLFVFILTAGLVFVASKLIKSGQFKSVFLQTGTSFK